jgi:hypothetical protein
MQTTLRRAALLVAVAAAIAVPQALAGVSVPLKGSDRGAFTLTADGCGSGVFAVVVDDVGRASHFGRYAYHSSECFDGATGLYSGTFKMTAANGDAIFGTYTGAVVSVVGDLGLYEQENVITGGTGRFAGAGGAFHLSGVANLVTLESSQTIYGSVSSPGGAKK